jgi:hypothetical protein
MAQPIHNPHYHLALALVRQTIMDALNGRGVNELTWLFSPLAQLALCQAMDLNAEGTLRVTRRAVRWMVGLAETGQVDDLRYLIRQRAYLIIPEWKNERSI